MRSPVHFMQVTPLLAAALFIPACTSADANDHTASAMQALQRVEDRLLSIDGDEDGKADAIVAQRGSLTDSLPTTADVPLGVGRMLRLTDAAPSRAVAFNANTVIYTDTHPGASTAVSIGLAESEISIETYTVIHDGAAPESYRFSVDLGAGEVLQALSDDTVVLLDAAGEVDSMIEAPWAVDAAGQAVPLTLAVDGNALVMTAHHTSGAFAYPIVADPSVKRMKMICKGPWLYKLACEAVVVEGGKAVYRMIRPTPRKCKEARDVWEVNSFNGSARFLGYKCVKW
ncbi:MAG: hypothetical protein M3680_12375 [Myxococcota bacterium]|nr:hypothetical protein [Myxococcota bacterium]